MGLVNFQLGDIGGLVKDLRVAITGEAIDDPNKQAELLYKLELMRVSLLEGQMAVNKAEANHRSVFVSGARPFIMWIGGFALGYSFILAPFLHSAFQAGGIDFPLPVIELGPLMGLITALLGIGVTRTWEKAKGIHNNPAY